MELAVNAALGEVLNNKRIIDDAYYVKMIHISALDELIKGCAQMGVIFPCNAYILR